MPTAEQVVQTAHEEVKAVERTGRAGSGRGGPMSARPAPRHLRKALLALGLASLVVVQGCGEDEQNRPLVYDKGTYQGQVDQKLDQDQIDALRQRAARQQM